MLFTLELVTVSSRTQRWEERDKRKTKRGRKQVRTYRAARTAVVTFVAGRGAAARARAISHDDWTFSTSFSTRCGFVCFEVIICWYDVYDLLESKEKRKKAGSREGRGQLYRLSSLSLSISIYLSNPSFKRKGGRRFQGLGLDNGMVIPSHRCPLI